MVEEVKMIMDEQTKRTVDSLRSSLEDVFAPLEKLAGIDSRLAEIGGGDQVVSAVRRMIEDVQDSIDGLSSKITSLVAMQEAGAASLVEIKTTLDVLKNPAVRKPRPAGARPKATGAVKKSEPAKAKKAPAVKPSAKKAKTPVVKTSAKKTTAVKRAAKPAENAKSKAKRKGSK